MKIAMITLLAIQSDKVIRLVMLLALQMAWISPSPAQTVVENTTTTDVAVKRGGSFSDFQSKKAIVPVFFCNGCPYSTIYIGRLKKMAATYQDVQFLLINASPYKFNPEESIENMAKFALDYQLNMPYLEDKEQVALKLLNALKCPEAFILVPDGSAYKVVYQGAIDDNPQVVNDVKEHYLKAALDQLLSGIIPAEVYVRPVGCVIKKK